MLSDFERKLLRIVFNYSSQRHRMPSMMELERVTGKPAATILQGLDVWLSRSIYFGRIGHIWARSSSLRHGNVMGQ